MTILEDGSTVLEAQMLAPLMDWLARRGQVRSEAVVATEVPWSGRWVDLAVLTGSRNALAFELKLRHNTRAIEQAALNRRAFDRSYVVTMTRPSAANFDLASDLGVGLILMSPSMEGLSLILSPEARRPSPAVRRRLRDSIRLAARAGI